MRLGRRIDPAGVDAAVQGLGDLGIDGCTESDHTTERRLDVAAGASESLIEIEVTERGVEIVSPHQADNTPAKPDAFGVSGRAVNRLRGLYEFVGLALTVLGDVSGGLLGGRILGAAIAALGNGCSDPNEQGQGRNGDALKNCNSKPVTNPKHEIPD